MSAPRPVDGLPTAESSASDDRSDSEQPAPARRMGPLAWLLAGLVRAYQLVVSPWLGPSCRFEPSCSAYALDALRLHGALRGSWLVVRRLARCQPFCTGGYDPVPEPRPSRRRFSFRRNGPSPGNPSPGDGPGPVVATAPGPGAASNQPPTASAPESAEGSTAVSAAVPSGRSPAMLSEIADPDRRVVTSEAGNPVAAGSPGRGAP